MSKQLYCGWCGLLYSPGCVTLSRLSIVLSNWIYSKAIFQSSSLTITLDSDRSRDFWWFWLQIPWTVLMTSIPAGGRQSRKPASNVQPIPIAQPADNKPTTRSRITQAASIVKRALTPRHSGSQADASDQAQSLDEVSNSFHIMKLVRVLHLTATF